MQYRLIALDLDGTLLTSQKEISPRTREALRAARERGIITAIATGRPPQSALLWSRKMGGGPVIGANGAALLDEQGRLIQARTLPVEPLRHLLRAGRQAGLLLECYTADGLVVDRPLEQMRAYFRWVRPGMGVRRALGALLAVWRINRIRPVRSLEQWATSPLARPVLKLMAIGPSDRLRLFRERVHRTAPGLTVVSSEVDNVEVTAAGVSKGSGLQMLAARLQIPLEQTLAFGDSGNDLEMIRVAGLGVAMGNATAEIKSAAGRIALSCDDDGVARVVEELCLS